MKILSKPATKPPYVVAEVVQFDPWPFASQTLTMAGAFHIDPIGKMFDDELSKWLLDATRDDVLAILVDANGGRWPVVTSVGGLQAYEASWAARR